MDNQPSSPSPSCPACKGATRIRVPAGVLLEKAPVWGCTACSTAFFAQRDQEPDYWQAAGQEQSYADPEVVQRFRDYHGRALRTLLARSKATGSLADMGCGDGLFLQLAREAGWTAVGVDPSWHAASHARSASGCSTIVARLEACPLAAGVWHAVTLWDVLEHLPDPDCALTAVCRCLRPGGILALRTPNENAAIRRLLRLAARISRKIAQAFLPYIYYHPHWIVYTRSGLASLCRRHGLEIVACYGEATSQRFAASKITHAYGKHSSRALVRIALPFAHGLNAISGGNKLVVFAAKT